jgi:exodeoxyribonuclease V beta subunit
MTAVRYRIPDALRSMPITGRFVVEASAGTGKTFLIEHRVLQLLAAGVPIDSILVVTFTEKATAELRGRIRALIARARLAADHDAAEHEAHIAIDEAVKGRLQDALFAADTAPIFTIHGFCQRVLTEHAFSSRRLFEQTHVAARTAFAGAFRAALREVLATDERYLPSLRAYLASGKGVHDLEALLFEIDQQPGELRPPFHAAAIEAAGRELGDAIEAIGGGDGASELCAALKVHGGTRKAIARRLHELADALAGAPTAIDLTRALDAGQRASFDYLLAKLPAEGDPRLARLRDGVRALRAAGCPLESAVAQALLPEVRARVRRDKDSRGELDFGDLLELVWESLRGAPGEALAARLRRRYPHALIDEFQDTDATQWEIFRRLYLGGEDAGSLAIIGDPKQAIYGFRGADVATYLRACDEVQRAGGSLLRLPKNFRSTPAVVAAYNRLVGDDETGPFFSGGIRYDEPVVAARAHRALRGGTPAAPARVLRLGFTGEGKPDAKATRRALARRIAAELRALLFDEPLCLEDGAKLEHVKASDIFVLTRSRGESDEIAAELRSAGVPCALFQQAGLFASAEATEVFELLLGVAEPERRSARFRAWQTRFFDVPLRDLPGLASASDSHPLVTRLRDWHALAAAHRHDELFSSILADSGIIERELFAATSERSLTNFQHVFELLAEEVSRSRCSIHELADRLKAWQLEAEQGHSDLDLQRLEGEVDAVQIMTVHKSKGLEAGIVFVYGACGEPPMTSSSVSVYRDGDQRVVHVGKPEGAIADAVAAEAAAEDQRLLYVALTRAKARLYLPLYPESKGTYAQLNARLARLVERAASDPELAAHFDVEEVEIAPASPGEPEGEDEGVGELAAEPADPPDPLVGWCPPPALLALPEPEPAVADASRRGFAMTSYTRLKRSSSAPLGREDFVSDQGGPPGELPPGELSPGAASGIFLHDVLERIELGSVLEEPDFGLWRDRADVRAVFDRALARHDRDPSQRRHSELMVHRALTTPVRALAMPCLAARERDARELEFLFPLPGEGERGFVRGFIDFVFVWRGRTYLLDWKSDVLPDYAPAAVSAYAAERYALQAQLYAIALAKLLGIRDARDHEEAFGGVLYWFLRGAGDGDRGIYTARPTFDELRAHEHALVTMEVS